LDGDRLEILVAFGDPCRSLLACWLLVLGDNPDPAQKLACGPELRHVDADL